jgi:Tfp pilus assembly protein PilX
MQKTASNFKNEKGSVVVIALMMLALLTIIGISATNTSTTEVQISSNEHLYKIAFYATEAGIEVGRAALDELKRADLGSWDNLLGGIAFTWQDADDNTVSVDTLDEVIDSTGDRNVGLATFNLTVRDNNDLDGTGTVDTDNTIYLTAVGSYRNATVRIETLVRWAGGDSYAQEHYDAGNSGNAARENIAVENNLRW